MNCSTFLKRLNDYIEGNLSMDMEMAMKKHLEECPSCRSDYEEEMKIEEAFKSVIQNEDIVFKSSRASIMNSIDKSMYEKKLSKRISLYFKKYKVMYGTCAALLIGFLAMSPHIFNKINGFTAGELAQDNASNNIMVKKAENKNSIMRSTEEKGVAKEDVNIAMTAPTVFLEEKYAFEKGDLKESYLENRILLEDNWSTSTDRKFSALIEGQNKEGTEEGIHPIILKENDAEKLYKFSFKDASIQYSPKRLRWLDEKNLLVTIGYGFGTITKGGDLFVVNIDTGNTYSVYKTQDDKKEIVDVDIILDNKNKAQLKLKLNVYEDENYTKSHIEERSIEDFKVVYDK